MAKCQEASTGGQKSNWLISPQKQPLFPALAYHHAWHPENYKALSKEIAGYRNKWKHISCSWIKRLNRFKIVVFSRLMYRVNAVSLRILADSFAESDKPILKFIWKSKGPGIAKTTSKNKNQNLWTCTFSFTTYYQTRQDKHEDRQINGIECLEMSPHIYSRLIFYKVAKAIQRKLSTNSSGTIGYPYTKEWSWTPNTIPYTKWMKDLKYRI